MVLTEKMSSGRWNELLDMYTLLLLLLLLLLLSIPKIDITSSFTRCVGIRAYLWISHITHHTSHITHHTSHITHHTSHITHHTTHHKVERHTPRLNITCVAVAVSAIIGTRRPPSAINTLLITRPSAAYAFLESVASQTGGGRGSMTAGVEPEVVSPLADTVRFIDGKQRDTKLLGAHQRVRSCAMKSGAASSWLGCLSQGRI